MDRKGQGALEYLLLIGGAVLVAVVVIVLLTTISDDKPARISAAKVSCLNTYGGTMGAVGGTGCLGDATDKALGDFAPANADYAAGCCWDTIDKVCSAKEYATPLPALTDC
ncbi:MAG: class III signal peptide-containing protein [Candidatus Diapherotrites archaeon]